MDELLLSDLLLLWRLRLLLCAFPEFRLRFRDFFLADECNLFLESFDCVLVIPLRDLLALDLGDAAEVVDPRFFLALLSDLEPFLPSDLMLSRFGVR